MIRSKNFFNSADLEHVKLSFLCDFPYQKSLLESGRHTGDQFESWKLRGYALSSCNDKYTELAHNLYQLLQDKEKANALLGSLSKKILHFMDYNALCRFRLLSDRAPVHQLAELFREYINGFCALMYNFRLQKLANLEAEGKLPENITGLYKFLGYDEYISAEIANKQKLALIVCEMDYVMVKSGYLIPNPVVAIEPAIQSNAVQMLSNTEQSSGQNNDSIHVETNERVNKLGPS